jgi:hypothetical protein
MAKHSPDNSSTEMKAPSDADLQTLQARFWKTKIEALESEMDRRARSLGPTIYKTALTVLLTLVAVLLVDLAWEGPHRQARQENSPRMDRQGRAASLALDIEKGPAGANRYLLVAHMNLVNPPTKPLSPISEQLVVWAPDSKSNELVRVRQANWFAAPGADRQQHSADSDLRDYYLQIESDAESVLVFGGAYLANTPDGHRCGFDLTQFPNGTVSPASLARFANGDPPTICVLKEGSDDCDRNARGAPVLCEPTTATHVLNLKGSAGAPR